MHGQTKIKKFGDNIIKSGFKVNWVKVTPLQ